MVEIIFINESHCYLKNLISNIGSPQGNGEKTLGKTKADRPLQGQA